MNTTTATTAPMNYWEKSLLNYSGGYLTYGRYFSREEKFVARFKHAAGDRAGFQSFLLKHFTPSEYFSRFDAGESPVGILESKGYLSAMIKRMLRESGYPATLEGKRVMLADQAARYAATAA